MPPRYHWSRPGGRASRAILLANFTWADIYEEHAGPLGREAKRFVAVLRDEIAQATAIFRAEPALPLTGMAPLIEVGMVVTTGRDRGRGASRAARPGGG